MAPLQESPSSQCGAQAHDAPLRAVGGASRSSADIVSTGGREKKQSPDKRSTSTPPQEEGQKQDLVLCEAEIVKKMYSLQFWLKSLETKFDQKFAYLTARHENEERQIDRLRLKVEDAEERFWHYGGQHSLSDSSDFPPPRMPAIARTTPIEDSLAQSAVKLQELVARTKSAQQNMDLHARQLKILAAATGVDLAAAIGDDQKPPMGPPPSWQTTRPLCSSPDKDVYGQRVPLPVGPPPALVPPTFKNKAKRVCTDDDTPQIDSHETLLTSWLPVFPHTPQSRPVSLTFSEYATDTALGFMKMSASRDDLQKA